MQTEEKIRAEIQKQRSALNEKNYDEEDREIIKIIIATLEWVLKGGNKG